MGNDGLAGETLKKCLGLNMRVEQIIPFSNDCAPMDASPPTPRPGTIMRTGFERQSFSKALSIPDFDDKVQELGGDSKFIPFCLQYTVRQDGHNYVMLLLPMAVNDEGEGTKATKILALKRAVDLLENGVTEVVELDRNKTSQLKKLLKNEHFSDAFELMKSIYFNRIVIPEFEERAGARTMSRTGSRVTQKG